MSKKLVGLALALVMLFGVAAMAQAQVKFKFGGWFRYRGVTTDNKDRNKDAVDDTNYYDVVFRPSFTATMEDKARVFFQLDIPSFNAIGGDDFHNFGGGPLNTTGGRTGVNVVVYNLQVKVPGVPGNWFVKVGRDNGFMPRGLVADVPTLRSFGIQVWGTVGMFKPRFEIWKRDEISMSTMAINIDPMEADDKTIMYKRHMHRQNANFNNGLALDDDDDLYVVKLPFTPSKGLRVMPYLAYWKSTDRGYDFSGKKADIDMFYPAVSASYRNGNYFAKLDFVYQTGEIDHESMMHEDYTASAYAFWGQIGGTWGPLSASVNYVFASGDDDKNDEDMTRFTGAGCAGTDSGVFCDAYAKGPTDLWFGSKYNDINIVGSRNIGGDGDARGNGTSTFTVDAAYSLMKNLRLQGTLGFIWSAEKRMDMMGYDRFSSSSRIGTEVDLSATWSIYKGVSLTGGFDYLFAGDYGELNEDSQLAADKQKPGWINDNSDSWQAVWKLQWFF